MNKRRPPEALAAGLAEAAGEPNSEACGSLLREALASRHWLPAEAAARLIGRHSLTGYEADLVGAYTRFREDGAKLDPGCRAKEAALTALDVLERFEPEPFLSAVRFHQWEPVWGGREDAAGAVRQRGLFALLRQHHPEAYLYAAELLADPLVAVRIGVAEALGTYGGAQAACLLVHRLHVGDEPGVLLACAGSLLELELDFTLALLDGWLAGTDPELREVGALALGQSRRPVAAETLIDWLETLTLERDLDSGIQALALHRSERARSYLLELVVGASPARARAAVRALALHRYDPELCARLRVAVSKSGSDELGRVCAAALARSGDEAAIQRRR